MLSRRRRIETLSALGLVLSTGVWARAGEADLAKVLPGPSVIYVGWSGADAAEPAFKETALAGLLAEPEVVRLCEALTPQIEALMKQHGGEADAVVRELLDMLWRHPGAIDVIRLTLSRKGPDVEAAVVWHLGADVERFEALVKPLLAGLFESNQTAKPTPLAVGEITLTQYAPGGMIPPLAWGRVGAYYVLTAGSATPKKVVASLTGQSEREPLIANEEFAASRKGLGVDGKFAGLNWYVSISEVARRLPLVLTILEMQRPKAERVPSDGRRPLSILIPRLMRALDIKQIKSLSGAIAPQGDGFRIAWYLNAPGGESGLMRFFHQKPLTAGDLAVVPRDANFFYATNFDLRGFYEEIAAALKEADPKLHDGWVSLIAEGERLVGIKLIDDVLGPLDDGWFLYNAPSSGGVLGTGMILAIEAKDAAHAERSLTALAECIVEHIGGAKARVATCKASGGQTVRFVDVKVSPEMAVIAPAWAAVGRYLVIGLYPQSVVTAVERLSQPEGELTASSILKRADFVARRKALPEHANAIAYLDAKDLLGGLYRVLLPVLSAATVELARVGIELDVSLWPRAQTVERHLFGMVSGLAADENGVLMVSHAPLPVPTPTARSAAVIAGLGLYGYVNQSRQAEAELAQLRTIALACHRYAAYHEERFPPDLTTLTTEKLLPKGASADCKYVAGLTANAPPDCVLGYSTSDLKSGADQVRAVLVTGQCLRMSPGELSKALAKAQKHAAQTSKPGTTSGDKP